MAEELTKTLTVKRTSKKKSGYSVQEEGSEYFLATAPDKARVSPGDRIVGINGISVDEFHDEDDANDLIESIRIVVVPRENLDKYDGIMQRRGLEEKEEDEDEEYEEYDRAPRRGAAAVGAAAAGAAAAGAIASMPVISHCLHCHHDNEDLSVDDEGDLVCENCGHVIDPPPSEDDVIHVCQYCNEKNRNLEPDEDGDLVCQHCGHVVPEDAIYEGGVTATCRHCGRVNHGLEPDEDGDLVCEECGHVIDPPHSDDDVIHRCAHCDYENRNLERDEEGDLVCQECGYVIPEESDDRTEDYEQNPKKYTYECPDCNHKTINPEPDDEGDRICEDCGCILPEKEIFECEVCNHENIDPEPNENGDFLCEHCNSALDVEEEYKRTAAEKIKALHDDDSSSAPGVGQKFDERGRPITNPEGKKLTPADMFSPGDVITVTVGKSNPKQDPGLKVEEHNGKYYVRKVPSGGLFAKTPVIAGDKVLELNGVDIREFQSVNELKKILKDESKITVVVLRRDPDASDSSASSVDYDELRAIKPPVGQQDHGNYNDRDGTRGTEDDDYDDDTDDGDTAPYDGEDCGCAWCPHCRE